MPERKTIERAQSAKRAGKAPTTQAGAFVKEEIDHVREGKHDVKNTKQAVAIGLSKARRAGVDLPPPKKGSASEATRKKAARDTAASKSGSSEAKSGARSGSKSTAKAGTQPTAGSSTRSAGGKSAAARSAAAKKGARTRAAHAHRHA
ncbi:MAG TPA: DUF6496 domain-containing protein [Burkholderiales bacterium]|jgi:hypothetical protein|nr:DUF6496 domain-containing protein [Burkholderiales bacterium]